MKQKISKHSGAKVYILTNSKQKHARHSPFSKLQCIENVYVLKMMTLFEMTCTVSKRQQEVEKEGNEKKEKISIPSF